MSNTIDNSNSNNGNNNGNGRSDSNSKIYAGLSSKSKARTKKMSKERLDELVDIRQSDVLGFYARGQTQMEIAEKLGVDQSTVSRDLSFIKKTARKKVLEVTENLSFEFIKYLKATDHIIREANNIASTEIDPHESSTTIDPNMIISVNMNNKNRLQALQLLLEILKQRFEVITGGPRSTHDHNGMTLINHGYDIKQEMKTPEQREEDDLKAIAGDLSYLGK